ncbi:calcium uniporter protein 6, mitochondrial [Physcomitrium patens]|uniref:Calcium uniporter protein C-terminal domain-containing protein n=1 Tax=Physcomitrium patens TaxID=3218 RepID=A0A2K1KJ61_PHYPA|nr:calcium uniporter protein 6, mitochondrial-like [Physcomitrium patens]PNR53808.1 hypothetical protein PHYPA_007483 [Physcomitrium patens]|eukprot:XP_024374924.1 calcium uniporter protein 6, mitochondrial-like [Physcomitrella patens]
MVSNNEEAMRMAQVFNQAGVMLMFRDKVHLHPEKITELVASVLPLSLIGEDNPRSKELLALLKEKEEIDRKAHKQMRLVLWTVLCGIVIKLLLFFRLTFWEFSWNVMEPIAFFTTASGLVCGYTYFMVTSSNPSYQDLMQRIFQCRQRNLFQKQNFDNKRFEELRVQCEAWLHPLPHKGLQDAHEATQRTAQHRHATLSHVFTPSSLIVRKHAKFGFSRRILGSGL